MYQLTQIQIPSNMPINAMAFYNQVFGWTFQLIGQTTFLSVTDQEEASPFQVVHLEDEGDGDPTIGSIEVKDVDSIVEKIQSEGGEIVIPKTAVPGIGWLAYFRGPDQHIFSLMQPDKAAA